MIILNSPQNPIGNQLINIIFFRVYSLKNQRDWQKHQKNILKLQYMKMMLYIIMMFLVIICIFISQMYNSLKIKIKECMCKKCRQNVFSYKSQELDLQQKMKNIQKDQICLNLSQYFFESYLFYCHSQQTIDVKQQIEIIDLFEEQSTMLLQGLVESKLNLHFWVPQQGYFLVTDIYDIEIPKKYFKDDEDGHQLTRDFAFTYIQLFIIIIILKFY
ncbi:unnamed protein product [Paramecium primaurelia]|uniref:Transmembrane protein n=1 Tax=Paramecium primaurelia TaxID=5886 RepID=A0A8S1LTF2_PARPR|nr:unnamed protein product [Paramecium primaurelia]